MRHASYLFALVIVTSAIAEEAPIVATLPGQPAARQSGAEPADSLGDYSSVIERASAPEAATPQGGKPIVATSAPSPQQPAANDSQAHGASDSIEVPPAAKKESAAPVVVTQPVAAPVPVVSARPPAPLPSAAPPASDSLGQTYSAKPAEMAVVNMDETEKAKGVSLLPARPEANEIRFAGTSAGEVVLRFAREYRVSIVFLGDGSTPITGWSPRTESVDEMLRAFFPAPSWDVSTQGGSYVISARSQLEFHRVTLSDLNPNLDRK